MNKRIVAGDSGAHQGGKQDFLDPERLWNGPKLPSLSVVKSLLISNGFDLKGSGITLEQAAQNYLAAIKKNRRRKEGWRFSSLQVCLLECLDGATLDNVKLNELLEGITVPFDAVLAEWMGLRASIYGKDWVVNTLGEIQYEYSILLSESGGSFIPADKERKFLTRFLKKDGIGLPEVGVRTWIDLGCEKTPKDIQIAAIDDACDPDEIDEEDYQEAPLVKVPTEFFDDTDYIPSGSPIALVLELARNTEVLDQPVARMVSAISVMSYWTSRNVVSSTGTWSNLLLSLIGPSGSGKEAANRTVKNSILDINYRKTPHGESGLFLDYKDHPKQIYVIDEVGIELKTLVDGKRSSTQGHKAALYGRILEFATSDGLRQVPPTYADEKRKSSPIVGPGFTYTGWSTPHSMKEFLTVNSMKDGFLPRFLTFEMPGVASRPKIREIRRKRQLASAPDLRLCEFAGLWGKLHGVNETYEEWVKEPQLKVFDFTDESADFLDEFGANNWDSKNKGGDRFSEAYTRASVLATRLALIFAANRLTAEDLRQFRASPDSLPITIRDVRLGCLLADASIATMIRLVGQAEDSNQFTKDLDRVENAVLTLSKACAQTGRRPTVKIILNQLKGMHSVQPLLDRLDAMGRIIKIKPAHRTGRPGRPQGVAYIHREFAPQFREQILKG